jgi:hypothetical protein
VPTVDKFRKPAQDLVISVNVMLNNRKETSKPVFLHLSLSFFLLLQLL